jgi:hypothetical protein
MQHYVIWQIFTYVSETLTASIINPEDGGRKFVRNTGIYLEFHMVLQPRRPTWTSPPP